MSNLVLVINAGSSSLKYQLIDVDGHTMLLKGNCERIGAVGGEFSNHESALAYVLECITAAGIALADLEVVGHRVVHGGSRFSQPTLITSDVISAIAELSALAPLHNPANIVGIEAVADLLPDVPQVAVFDTAFHTTIPDFASTYAISAEVARTHGIKRYGFFILPMDESLARVVVDVGGRPHLVYHAEAPTMFVRDFNIVLVKEFCRAFSNALGANLHVQLVYGEEPHPELGRVERNRDDWELALIRAALDALFDHGRPACVRLLVLIDRGHRELPIEAQYVGRMVQTTANEIIEVKFKEIDNTEKVLLVEKV